MTDQSRSTTHGQGDTAVTSPATGYVILTRPAGRADELAETLRRDGLRTIHLPAIRIDEPGNPLPLRNAVRRFETYDWVVLTSASGVRAVVGALAEQGREPRVVGPRRLAVVGSATARAARNVGWEPDLIPATFTGEALLEALVGEDVEGLSLLLPLARNARDVLPRGLASAGGRVERVEAYRTEGAEPGDVERVRRAMREGDVGLVTFTSPSTAEHFLESVGEEALGIPAAVIGPVTAGAARELGFEVVAVAEEHTVQGLARAARAAMEARVGPEAAESPEGPEAAGGSDGAP